MIFDSRDILFELFVNKESDIHVFNKTIGDNTYYLYMDRIVDKEYYCYFKMNDIAISSNFFNITNLKSIEIMLFELGRKYHENTLSKESEIMEKIENLNEEMKKNRQNYIAFVTDFYR